MSSYNVEQIVIIYNSILSSSFVICGWEFALGCGCRLFAVGAAEVRTAHLPSTFSFCWTKKDKIE